MKVYYWGSVTCIFTPYEPTDQNKTLIGNCHPYDKATSHEAAEGIAVADAKQKAPSGYTYSSISADNIEKHEVKD